ncbi:hypothetical protein FLAVO9R_100244 [Flavobacterium sp. 9R]|uniref:hypothetical protein n=1 Tax=Flavobacterium sp. 9R TaxID=2653143 RepID=UPI0012F26CF1|nr:hypothetical protein [Flavobacterium sp. 9R]VXB06426.1 hypothetical protein FLAVO9R_100244 [Flavobacterium sp. 9R]
MNNTKFYINTFKLQKSIDAIVLAMENSFKDIQSSLDVLKKLFYEEDDWLATKKYLDNLSLKELEELLFSNDNTFNANFSKQLYNYYINRTLFEISKKSFKSLSGVLKNINNLRKKLLQNKREQIRKICCFNFKNLDDTHSVIVFN